MPGWGPHKGNFQERMGLSPSLGPWSWHFLGGLPMVLALPCDTISSPLTLRGERATDHSVR